MKRAGYNVKRSNSVSARIYWLKLQGLVETTPDKKHKLTEKGKLIYKTLKDIYLNYAKSSEKIRKILGSIGIYQTGLELLKFAKIGLVSFLPKILKEISKVFELTKEEEIIVKYLLEYYIKFGSIYVTFDMLLEDLRYDARYLRTILNKLRAKRLVYTYMNREEGVVKVGLKPEIRLTIKKFLRQSSSRYTGLGLLEFVDDEETLKNNSFVKKRLGDPAWRRKISELERSLGIK